MKIFTADQSSKSSGYCVTEDGKYIESGTITKSDKIPIETRIVKMGLAICAKIKEFNPDLVAIEDIQCQSSVKTVIQLARLQGCIMLYCASKGIEVHILAPTQWRATLGYEQGPKVKREALKEQSLNFAKEFFPDKDMQEDEAEACCINVAAQKLYNTK